MEKENLCIVCGKLKPSTNKKYCSKTCRYKDSEFKRIRWNSKESLEKNPKYRESIKRGGRKQSLLRKKRAAEGTLKVWNKGLTKETDDRIKKISEDRKGKNNPIHKVLSDPRRMAKWGRNISKSLKGKHRGPLEQRFGKKRADKIKKILSNAAKKRTIHGHTGKKHTPAAKRKMSISISKALKAGKMQKAFTMPMKFFHIILRGLKINELFVREYILGRYSIDFCAPTLKLAIEVDGDFWHSNPLKFPDGPIYDSQKANLINDKKKEKYLKKKGWHLLRFWENDIYTNPEDIANILLETIDEISKT